MTSDQYFKLFYCTKEKWEMIYVEGWNEKQT